MSASLLDPPPRVSSQTALHMSQQAPRILQSSPTSSLLLSSETPETWTIHENLLLSCLRTGDDKSARLCLDRMTARFGRENERVMALKGMYEEAAAVDKAGLENVLKEYESTLKADPTNMPVRKRRVALLRSMSRPADAIAALVELLDVSPTDAESWAELSDLYASQNMYAQAIYSLEEVLLIMPNAWSIHARMGELLYLSASTSFSNSSDGNTLKGLSESMRRFCRSIELCDDYLRGYYGLKLTTKRLLTLLPEHTKPTSASTDPIFGDLAPPSVSTVQKLHELATSKLAEIVRRGSAKEPGWGGYDEAELVAARELLAKDAQKIER
ncbi:hypothetical protein AOQ84DRAFT_221365 [Glonium stellatum]|uniref:ER membrane protein complex subunit 2 n=1 Tax=Glonium stellatum TaxID=574774 RepID=A0A8E2F1X1_9PEZI|nr:hypothetical protein AOQ84DRAFT_221365 [Glonium stellatum]